MIQNVFGIGYLYKNPGLSGIRIEPASQAVAPIVGEPQDRVTISKEAQNAKQDPGSSKDEKNLSSEQKQQVNELKQRDAEVKAHEQAHMAAGGGVVQGGAAYQYERGPDGKMYAVGGEVKIDVSFERTPEATITKMQQVQRAALAPAQPSATDRAVAARAAQVEARTRAEKTKENSKPTGKIPEDSVVAKAADTPELPAASPTEGDLPQAHKFNQPGTATSSETPGLRIDLRI